MTDVTGPVVTCRQCGNSGPLPTVRPATPDDPVEPYRVLVTGSRYLQDGDEVEIRRRLVEVCARRLLEQQPIIVVQGGDPGVARIAGTWAEDTDGVTQEGHPDWRLRSAVTLPRRDIAVPRRNATLVARGADVCVAFPRIDSNDTWDCLRKAADAGIPGLVYPL